jgi:hypothetical protein
MVLAPESRTDSARTSMRPAWPGTAPLIGPAKKSAVVEALIAVFDLAEEPDTTRLPPEPSGAALTDAVAAVGEKLTGFEPGIESRLIAVPRQLKEGQGPRQPRSAAPLAEAPQYSSLTQQFFCSPPLLPSDGHARYMSYRIVADPDGGALYGKRGAKPGSDGEIEEAFELSPRSKPGFSDSPCVRVSFEENIPFEPAL